MSLRSALDRLRGRSTVILCAACLLMAGARPAFAQPLPYGPVTAAGGRLTIGGDASIAVSPDDEAYFNYSDYDYNLLRQIRADASAAFRLGPRLSFLGDVRVQGPVGGDGSWSFQPYALFARIRPWAGRNLDVQAGLIPPVFGTFSRRAYATDNPLIGFPLAYQYLTSLRPDAIPRSADDLAAMRGRGWLTVYPEGNLAPDHGVPLVDGLHYQTGVEVHAGSDPIEVSAAVTTGTISTPELTNWTSGPQVSGRLAWHHGPGLRLGVSAARGTFVSRSVTDALGPAGTQASNDQRAIGFDAEFSRGHWLVRSEGVLSSWRIPALRAPVIDAPLRAWAVDVEGRYRLTPGLYVAARLDRLDFSRITGSTGAFTWDAPVRRVEVGGGYSLQRNMVVKAAYQYNWRDTINERTSGLFSAQLLVWF